MCGHTISSKRLVVLCTKIIKIGGRITKLQSVEKWRDRQTDGEIAVSNSAV